MSNMGYILKIRRRGSTAVWFRTHYNGFQSDNIATQEMALDILRQAGFEGEPIVSAYIKDASTLVSDAPPRHYGRDERGPWVSYNSDGSNKFRYSSLAEVEDTLEARVFDWAGFAPLLRAAIGRNLREDRHYELLCAGNLGVRNCLRRAGLLESAPSGLEARIELLLNHEFTTPTTKWAPPSTCNLSPVADDDCLFATPAVEQAASECRSGKAWPRLKRGAQFIWFDPIEGKTAVAGIDEHRRQIFDLEDRYKALALNLNTLADFQLVVELAYGREAARSIPS